MLKLNYPLTLLLVKICEEIRRLQEKEVRYQRIFENTGTGLVIFGKDLVISMVNSGFEEITGYSREEVEGKKKLTEFISEPDRKIAINYHSMRSNGENPPCEYELMLIDRHENIKHILFKIDVIDSTQERVASLTEITRLKLIEKVVWENERQISLLTARMSEMERKRHTELKTGKNEKKLHKKHINFAGIVCKSPSMKHVCDQILNAAANDASVVIYGETGTGKDLAARAIHNMSNRSQNEFVAVNCGAIPDSLFESEFFGYKKGAFTCAETDKAGYFDIADKGTLFLDEVGNMSLNTQMKLLRAIEGKGYMPIGNNRIQNSCFRIITATNINLLECVAKGLMRKDFFYRINVISINIPPLRKRKEDIPLLVEYYLEKNNAVELFDFVNEKISSNLKHYDWPGNVRELQNLIMRLLTFKNKKIWNDMEIKGIEAENITDEIIQQDFLTFNMAVEKYEKNLILNALEQNQWHRGKTACSLGLSRRTFYRKLEKYEIISQ